MTLKKHLVLDQDVYQRLMRRKSETGLTASHIGNAILRTCLDGNASFYRDLRDKLIASGNLTEEVFDEAFRETVRSQSQPIVHWTDLFKGCDREHGGIGSWEVREIGTCHGECQVVEFTARDAKEQPIPLHHNTHENRVQVLAGQVLFVVDYRHMILGAPQTLAIPSGTVHSVTPLTEDASFLSIMVPS